MVALVVVVMDVVVVLVVGTTVVVVGGEEDVCLEGKVNKLLLVIRGGVGYGG